MNVAEEAPVDARSAGPFRSWAVTHAGTVREVNEDAFVNRPDLGLWAVADGVGGGAEGDTASRMVADALEEVGGGLDAQALLAEVQERILGVHTKLRERAAATGGMVVASTVVVLMARGSHFACLWAGDSRAYVLRQGVLCQVTRDHSLVQEMVDRGDIVPAQADSHRYANVITRAVGAEVEALDLDTVTDSLLPGDRVLLCSDGLFKVLSESDVVAGLGAADVASPAEWLLRTALERQARDNVTVLVLEVLEEAEASETTLTGTAVPEAEPRPETARGTVQRPPGWLWAKLRSSMGRSRGEA